MTGRFKAVCFAGVVLMGCEKEGTAVPGDASVVASSGEAGSSGASRKASATCAEAPAPVGSLQWGDIVSDDALAVVGGEQVSNLTAAFPAVLEVGGKVGGVTLIDLDGGGSAEVAAFVVPAGAEPTAESRGTAARHDLWLFSCEGSELKPIGEPIRTMSQDGWVTILSTQSLQVPGGSHVSSIRTIFASEIGEFVMYELLVGQGTAQLPVTEPKGGSVGLLAYLEVGRQTAFEGGMYREESLGGSGWFPLGAGQVFVSLYYAREASEMDGSVAALMIGSIDEKGVLRPRDLTDAWLLVGKGELPEWCNASTDVRCAPIDTKDFQRATGKKPRYDWMAGTWGTAEEAGVALTKLGAGPDSGDWLFLGEVVTPEEGESVEQLEAEGYRTTIPPAPGGKKAVTTLYAN